MTDYVTIIHTNKYILNTIRASITKVCSEDPRYLQSAAIATNHFEKLLSTQEEKILTNQFRMDLITQLRRFNILIDQSFFNISTVILTSQEQMVRAQHIHEGLNLIRDTIADTLKSTSNTRILETLNTI